MTMILRPTMLLFHRCTMLLILLAAFFHSSSGAQTSSVQSTTNPQGPSLEKQVQTNTFRLQQNQLLNNQLGQMLASIQQPSQESITNAENKNQALRQQLALLENGYEKFTIANLSNNASVADLNKLLSDAEKARDDLVKKQTDELSDSGPTNLTKGLRQEASLQGLKPVIIKLVKNRVVPLMDPFYSGRRAQAKLALTGETVDVVVFTRVYDGEAVANAVRDGGLLDRLLSKADPKNNYFQVQVCSDSIPAFHTVVDTISKHGFAYSWDTANDEDIVQRVSPGPNQSSSEPLGGYYPIKKE